MHPIQISCVLSSHRSAEAHPEKRADWATFTLTSDFQEHYVALLCRFQPKEVYQYLCSHKGYRLEACLNICQEHGLVYAMAYLWDRIGETDAALELILTECRGQIDNLRDLFASRLQPGLCTGDGPQTSVVCTCVVPGVPSTTLDSNRSV